MGGVAVLAALGLLVHWRRRSSAVQRCTAKAGAGGALGAGTKPGQPPPGPGSHVSISTDGKSALKSSYTCSMPQGPATPGTPANDTFVMQQAAPGGPPGIDPLLASISARLAASRLSQSAQPSVGCAAGGSTGAGSAPGSLGAATSAGEAAVSARAASAVAVEMEHWAVKWEELHLEQPCGRGSFGWVYRASWRRTPCAVKVLISQDELSQQGELSLPERTMRELQQEAAIMIRMRHPNIVSFMGLCTRPACLITEYCARGSLYEVLQAAAQHADAAATLTWRLRLRMAADGARGLLYLHSQNVVHRDVKSPNFLVDEYYRVKTSDFGLSRILGGQPDATTATSTGGGVKNPLWLAPEVLQGGRAAPATDVYAFGIVLWELLVWRRPWEGLQVYQIPVLVSSGGRPEVPPREELPGADPPDPASLDAYCALMSACWAQDPAQRPTFDEVVQRLEALF